MQRKKIPPRQRRKWRVRRKVKGTAERPRLCVFRSNRQIYTQIIDDVNHQTLAAASTLSEELKNVREKGGNKTAAQAVGALVARKALEKNIKTVVFDRAGYLYHGRVKALADAARQEGLKF